MYLLALCMFRMPRRLECQRGENRNANIVEATAMCSLRSKTIIMMMISLALYALEEASQHVMVIDLICLLSVYKSPQSEISNGIDSRTKFG